MHSFARDLRMALRGLRRAPAFTCTAVLTLALGIATSTAVFSVLDAAVLRALPFPDPERLVVIQGVAGPERSVRAASYLEVRDWAARSRATSHLSIYDVQDIATSWGGEADLARTEIVSASYFPMLGARPALGRAFSPAEDRVLDRDAVAVISHELWQRRFEGDPGVLGATLTLNRRAFTVIGVMPEGFAGLAFDAQAWIPAAMDTIMRPASALEDRGSRWLGAVARLRPGVDLAAAQRDLDRISRELAAEHPESNDDRWAQAVPLRELALGDTGPMLRALFGAAGLLLLVACVNVAALQLVRATVRERQAAIFRALGASTARVMGHSLVEGLLLAAAGGAGGLIAARLLLAWQVPRLPDGVLPPFASPTVDSRSLLFATAAAALSGILFGALPALRRRVDLAPQLRQGTPAASGGMGRLSRPRAQQLLVVAEVAVSLVLLVGAGLLGRTLWRLSRVDPGFTAERQLGFSLALPVAQYPVEARARAARRLHDELAAIPGVESVAIGSDLPLRGSTSAGMLVRAGAGEDAAVRHYRHRVLPDYFAALGIPILRGRGFTDADDGDAPPVAIVSRSAARRIFGNVPAVGRRLSVAGPEGPWIEVVGVAGDVRYRDLTTDLGATGSEPDVYFPYAQSTDDNLEVAVRSAAEPAALLPLVRAAVARVDAELPLLQVATLRESLESQTALRRLGGFLLGTFAAAALALAALGIYGIVAYTVGASWREIALRLALGGRAASVVALVVRQGMTLVALGVALGVGVSLAVSRALAGLLFGVAARDPLTYVVVSALLGGIALLATLVPAWRAASLEPQAVLRGD